MCMVDYEVGKVYRRVERHARKQHRCTECRRTIEPGERYEYVTSLSAESDYWYEAKTCAHCVEATRWLRVVCDGYIHEMVAEDLRNHVDGDEDYMRSAPLTRLVRWQVDRWRAKDGSLRSVESVAEVVDSAIAAAELKLATPA